MGNAPQTQQTQTTTTKLSPQQKQLWLYAKPGIREFAAEVPKRAPFSSVAPFDPLQKIGQREAVQAAWGQKGLTTEALDANRFLLGDIWNPESNPYLGRAIDAAVRPITEQYHETVLPGIRDEALQSGQQFGGSRRGVAEGIAGGRYLDAVGDTSSKLVQDQYGNNLTAMVRGLGLVPQTTQAATLPAQTLSGVGDIRQRLAQAALQERLSNYTYDQYAPFLQSKEIMNIMTSLPGGTTVSTANNPPQAPWWQQALGAASTGVGLLSSLAAPMTGGASMGIGALLPFLG